MNKTIRPALVVFALLTILTGLLYPLLVTSMAQLLFPHQANGSLIEENGKLIGSSLIGQHFSDARYFWGRPSATSPQANNGANSAGTNLGPNNPAQQDAVAGRIAALKAAGPVPAATVPVDLVTASGSGLDPDISPAAAYYQTLRIAAVRKLPVERVRQMVARHTTPPQWGIFGEARVNVLQLNLDLDQLTP
jgi:K+-transporting ATPase ATPase C chain